MKISDMTVDTFWKGEVRVQALVDDGKETCKTKIFIKGSQIYDYSCSCAEGNSFRGVCMHGRALFEEYALKEKEERKIPVYTSQAVRTMIREYTNREVAQIVGEEETESVSLIPRLQISRRDVTLECRIQGKRQYLIKELSVFAEAVRTGKRLEYGKLSFEHRPSAFTQESQPLLQMVLEETGSYCDHYEEIRGVSYTAQPSLRRLNLNRAARDRFFSLAEGKSIAVEDYRGHERNLLVLRRNPSFAVKVKRISQDGISVSIPGNIMAYSGIKNLYVADSEYLCCCDKEYTEALGVFLEQILEGKDDWASGEWEIQVNERDIPLFYERVLKRMEALGLLDDGGLDWEGYRPEELKARFEFDSSGPGEVSMTPILSYGSFSFHPLDDEKIPRAVCRDVPGEVRISRLITKYFEYREDGTKNLLIRGDEDAIYRLLSGGMEQFEQAGEVWLSESFRALKVLPPPKISLGVSVSGGWLELNVDSDGMNSAELMKILSEYRLKKKYYRMKSGEFLELTDDGLMTLAKLCDGLALGKNGFQSGSVLLPAYRAFYLDSLVRENGRVPFRRDRNFSSMVRDLKSVEDLSFVPLREQGKVLREYQRTGFCWLKMLDHYRLGGILADDMGLGKTLQIITLLASEKASVKQSAEEFPSTEQPAADIDDRACEKEPFQALIVCPASLVYNWGHEFSVFAPSMKVLTVTGTFMERQKILETMDEYDVIVTSYDLLKRDLAVYLKKEFRFEVIDEAQFIKNASTQSAKAVKAIRAVSRFALTGTPIENRLSELWSIFDFLMPGFLFSYRKFKTMFELPIVKEADRGALEELHRMIRPFVLRRLKSDVLKELPAKLEKVVYSAADGRQKELYDANALKLRASLSAQEPAESSYREALEPAGGRNHGGNNKIQILAELTKLRQICCDPSLCYENYNSGSAKLETCISLIVSAVESGHKLLLFSQFASMLRILAERLEKEGIAFHLLTGAASKEERNRMVNSFHKDAVPVFLISLKAGGTGLNLTAADMVIHYDPWWNVAAQNQATDRAHRIGQNRQVTVYRLIMKNTIEENILKLQESKRFLADQIVTEGMVSLGELGREELLKILGEG